MTIKGDTVNTQTADGGAAGPTGPATFGDHIRHHSMRVIGAREFTLAAVVVLLIIVLSFVSPFFFTPGNLTVVGRQIGLGLIISVGMTFVILIGGIDLSVGSVVALVSVLTGQFMVTIGLNPAVSVLLALLAGVAVGYVNGIINAFGGLPSFVVTLGMLAVARGLALGITSGSTISGFPESFLFLGQGQLLGIPIPIYVAAVVAIAAHVVLSRTMFGRHVYFVGSNEEAAKLSGIRVRRIKVTVFVIASTLAAVSGILETSRLSVGQPAAGSGYELVAIGAAVIGGASLFGGVGSILGTALGTTLLLLIQNALILLGISPYWQQVFSGVIIVAAVALNMWRKKRG
ncbi:ABC transporter permease [Arthrobacter burdickii]|uniref:ABC transporter permease n=1 Tax=Arthrobacter burdickii TaxID=3035920 RepID=A0ABT8K454_9MICC|nr:ABC transporter permease [Arthrobacter burdickii]MDN4612236.1 ABC transporter permease [Arthrobacter burdickii]